MIDKRFRSLFIPLLFFAALPLWGDSGIEHSAGLSLQTSTRPEAKLGFTWNLSVPLLQGEGPLTEGNNLNLALGADVSPISLNGSAEAVFTPIAFLQAVAGGRIGSGWNINLFGGDVYGMGINRRRAADLKPEVSGSAFNGLLWSAWGGGVFQFDLAALVPGDWSHVVFRTYHEARYKGDTAASSSDSWYYESDDGQNRNGFNYYGNYLLGYQMPIFLNTVGLMAEMDLYLYDTPKRGSWGDELPRWTFGPLFNFTVTEKFSAALIVQFRTRRNYTAGDEDDLGATVFYQDRRLKDSDPLYLTFYRAAAILSYKLW
ncbi:conserved hypothetical protein [Treponema primitia ZAS-2]|uniref:Uncharacterized protein n=1 Tax=Treponema primitia (strain ATCC BAA-887 / DSM 12427 / ZAS-2) TaxID=545694 RepID=F5YJK2_TREPZ|nr:hypothetical protein [Treponema primitia]AEF83573.1 conserved hypothetical protein [Treponema primitia ZAS-2]